MKNGNIKQCSQGLEEVVERPRARVTGACELPDMVSGYLNNPVLNF